MCDCQACPVSVEQAKARIAVDSPAEDSCLTSGFPDDTPADAQLRDQLGLTANRIWTSLRAGSCGAPGSAAPEQ